MSAPPVSELSLGAVVAVFNPSDEQLERVHAFFAQQPDVQLAIVDNSLAPTPRARALFGSRYLHNGNRGGIAGAFNRGVRTLRAAGCDFFFTFDQDSLIGPEFFASFRAFIAQHGASLVCPSYVDINSGTAATFVVLRRFSFQILTAAGHVGELPEVTSAISSGLGFSHALFVQVGGFREDYFIDHVDSAFCYAAWEHGIGVHVHAQVVLKHAIGKRELQRFLGITMVPSHHPPSRRYYMARNGVDLARRTCVRYPAAVALETARIGHEILSVVLFEEQKARKLRAIVRGWADGLRGQLGVAPAGL